ncbi:MAG TPA: NAD-dependent epimerase/dehydratase family protein, partial [Chloroflexota bacterium]|nr:NAD-dependent epimerase/dehydratase family protein [Chloroflexota bacterium]
QVKALVTGGAGFVGSHLCRRLLADGCSVICLDNFASGLRRNIEPLLEHKHFALIEQDVSAGPLPKDLRADRYFHLASPASPNPHTPRSYMALPLMTARANSIGLQNVLDLAKEHGSGRVLFASTSEVYGDPQVHPQREDYWGNVSSTGPRSCYDEAKRFGEALSMIYVRSLGLDVRIVRIFNTYGPNMDPKDGRMLPNFITQALRNHDLTIYGDGQYTRSLCYVQDLVDGLLAVMESSRADAAGRVYNLGNPQEHTILDYARLVLELIPSSTSTITYLDPVPDDPSRRRPDIGRARSELGWQPRVELKDGMRQTIDYFSEVSTAA